jgi:hypothetical protein
LTSRNGRLAGDVDLTAYDHASYEPQLVLAPRATFVSVRGAGSPATEVWHRKKRLVADIARQLVVAGASTEGPAADAPIAEHMQYHYLEGMPPADIADFYSVNPLTELHYRAMARVSEGVTADDIARARRAAPSASDDDDEVEIFTIPEQLVVQVMHHGPFSGELETLARLGEAAETFGVVRSGPHQEIHLDPFTRETAQDTLRTILRDPVESTSGSIVSGGRAADRLAAAEALYRYAAGVDLKDDALLASAFTEDAVADLSRATAKVGLEYPPIEGRETIVAALSGSLRSLDTTHTVSNPRVEVEGDRARLEAIVAAQHLPHGDHSRNLLMTNRYELELVRRGRLWLIERLMVDNAWTTGDHAVFAAV